MRPLIAISPLLALLLVFQPVSAACWTTSSPEVNGCNVAGGVGTDDANLPCYYADWDPLFGIFLYYEDNNIGGLQRSDPGRDDTCNGFIIPDQLVVLL